MGYEAGIDLGTTYTSAALRRDGWVELVPLGDRSTVMPSVVFIHPSGEVLVGEAANRRAVLEPERVAREFKRRVGDPTPMLVGGSPYPADSLIAHLLQAVMAEITQREGAGPDAIALTHPANWGDYKLDFFRQAVARANLGEVKVTYLSEPEAAARHYAATERVPADAVVAVYDLGGGTFDAAVLRRRADEGFELVGQPEGIERLGGVDFDAGVMAHVDGTLDGAVSRLDESDEAALQALARLRSECIEAKEALSRDVDVAIPVVLPDLNTSVRLTRAEFEAIIRPALRETITALRQALRSASVQPDDVHAVLLVGGSSRIPTVAEMVSAELGRPVAVDAHPKHAVAQGAALAVAPPLVPSSQVASPPASEPTVPQSPGPPRVPRVERKWLVRSAVAAVAAVALVLVGLLATRGGDDGGPGDQSDKPVAERDPMAQEPPDPAPAEVSDPPEEDVPDPKPADVPPASGTPPTSPDPELQGFIDGCASDAVDDCDRLFQATEDEDPLRPYADSCGNRLSSDDGNGECTIQFHAVPTGADPGVQGLIDGCASDAVKQCDELYSVRAADSPLNKDPAMLFARTCGHRFDEVAAHGNCLQQFSVVPSSSDAERQGSIAGCEEGALDDCDRLTRSYGGERWLYSYAMTCGYRLTPEDGQDVQSADGCVERFNVVPSSDNADLQGLVDGCEEGAVDDCDRLYETTDDDPLEIYANSCGHRLGDDDEADGECTVKLRVNPSSDTPQLQGYVDGCAGDDVGDCDRLWDATEDGDPLHSYAATCGHRMEDADAEGDCATRD